MFFGDDNSRDFALIAQDALNEKFNMPNAGRNFSILKTDKYILNESPCPAVIIECGFLSNPVEEQKLCDKNYQSQLAQKVYKGVLLYLSAGSVAIAG